MARRVRTCLRFRYGQAYCVFSKLVKYGKQIDAPEGNCRIAREDEYNLYPRCVHKNGDFIWMEHEPRDQDPIPLANRVHQFESLTPHWITGDEYYLSKGSRRHEESHPLYHIVDFNAPINRDGYLGEDEVAEMVGDTEFFLTSGKWYQDRYGEPKKALGNPRVRTCTGLYGMLDKFTGIVTHKSMRSHWANISWWKNYTTVKEKQQKKTLNIFDDIEKVEEYIVNEIKDDTVVSRIMEGILYLRDGKYFNIRTLMRNNEIAENIIRKVMSHISLTNPRTLHRTSTGNRYDPDKIRSLYVAIRDGKIPIPSYKRKTYLANIVNYLMNDIHGMKKVDIEKNPTLIFKREDRYWHVIAIIKSAVYKDKIVKEVGDLPKWFKILLKKDAEARKHVLDIEPQDISPPVVRVREICGVSDNDNTIYADFKDVCKLIQKITKGELTATWEHFEKAHINNNPKIFWSFIDDIRSGIDTLGVCSPQSKEVVPNFADLIHDAKVNEDSLSLNTRMTNSSPYWDTKEMEYGELDIEDNIDPRYNDECIEIGSQGMHVSTGFEDYEFTHLSSVEEIKNGIE